MRSPPRLVVGALLAAAAAVFWLRLDTSPAPEVGRFRDDAYYFFSWARSLAAGDGPCVTPGVATNGVQLLWGLVLAAAAAVAGPAALPAVAHALGLVLHLATAGALWWWLRGLGVAALCAALLLAGNPLLLTEAQNGQETALACLAAAALLVSPRWGERGFLLAAVAATLARSDLYLLVPFLALHRHGPSWRAAVVPAAALGAYAAANWLVAGTVTQDSAAPIPWLFAQHFEATEPSALERWQRLWWWLRPCLLGGPWSEASAVLAAVWVFVACRRFLPGRLRVLPLAATASGWALGAADLAVPWIAALLIAAVSPRGFEREELPLRAMLLGWAAIVLLHFVWRHYPRPYYFASMAVVGAGALAVLQARRPRLGVLVALLCAGLQLAQGREPAERRRWQEESRMAGLFLRELVPSGEPVGCFNAGVIGYLDPGPVIDLDGVVNRPAFEALRRGQLDRYLDDHGVRYLVDVPVQFALHDPWPHASGRHFGPGFDPARDLREIARFDVPGVEGDAAGTDSVRLYARVGRGASPRDPGAPRVLGLAPDGARYVLWTGAGAAELYCTPPGGGRSRLARGVPGAALVVKVPTPAPGRYILHIGDPARPILVLEKP